VTGTYDFGSTGGATWPAAMHAALSARRVRLLAHVPDGGNAALIAHSEADPAMAVVPLTTEEEGVGVITGAWLGGMRAALAVQSSGVGNCGNLFAMLRSCTFPALLIVSMRGERGEFVPWQIPMGQAAPRMLELFDFDLLRLERAEEAGEVTDLALRQAFLGGRSVALLVSQRLIGSKSFGR
jgi:sulfopyruvate decarboxylase alpha subunit